MTITDTAGFPDLKQPQLSGLSGILPPPGVPPGSTVPEPSTFLLWIVPFLGMAALAAKKVLVV